MATHYEALGVSKDADPATIKKAWRKIALNCHPDRAEIRGVSAAEEGRLAEKFKLALQAWTVLGDEGLRAEYDRKLKSRLGRSVGGATRRRTQRAQAYGDSLWRKAQAEQSRMAAEWAMREAKKQARAEKKRRDAAWRAKQRREAGARRREAEKENRRAREAAFEEAQIAYLDRIVERLRCEIGAYLLDRI